MFLTLQRDRRGCLQLSYKVRRKLEGIKLESQKKTGKGIIKYLPESEDLAR